jgi:hypothetical protein
MISSCSDRTGGGPFRALAVDPNGYHHPLGKGPRKQQAVR